MIHDSVPPADAVEAPRGQLDDDAAYLHRLGYKQELNRALGLFSSFGVQFTSISVGSIIFTTLVVGFEFFGPASFWAFVVGGAFQVFFMGLAVAELVSAYPLSGGVYQIVNRLTKARWLGWQAGWWLVIAHTVAVTAVAVAIVPFVAGWFGYSDLSAGTTTLCTLGILVAVTLINVAGVKVAAFVNNLGVFAEIAGILVVVGALLFVKYQHAPLSTLNDTAGTVHGGWWLAPFLFAMLLPAFTISSFDATGNAAEETKSAAWIAPLGTVMANISAYIVGIVFIFLLVRAIPDVSDVMASATPVEYILSSSVGGFVTNAFEAFAIVALLANMVMVQLTGVRVMWAKARDGQMPAARWLRKINRQQIPINATLVCAALSMASALYSPLLSVLASLTALAWALAYGVVVTVGLAAVVRKTLPPHPFRLGAFSFFVFAVATAWSVVLCATLVKSDPLRVGLGMLVTVTAGFVVYLFIPADRRARHLDPAD
ncbi:APC family permease [Streptomyces malaysiensis]|uniref:APC family permease n=1 Tax=Streptomyces malaysiensis TaxID=92644 RepID=UPI002B2DFE72|nr:amino acid permease [Streptomyces malaysiensis]